MAEDKSMLSFNREQSSDVKAASCKEITGEYVCEFKNKKIFIVYPAQGTPLYTAEEYKRFLEKYPDISEEERIELAAEQGRGFGYQYMSAVHRSVESIDKSIWQDWNKIREDARRFETNGVDARDTVKTLNSVNDLVGKEVDKIMKNYLTKHNYTIDCWPDSETDFGFLASNIEEGKKVKLNFDYFSSDFKADFDDKNNKYIIRRDGAKVFRHNCMTEIAEKPQQLKEIEDKIAQLEKVPTFTDKQRRKSKIVFVLSLMPLFFLLAVAFTTYTSITEKDVLGIGSALLSVESKIVELFNSGIAGKIITTVPLFLSRLLGMVMGLVIYSTKIFNGETVGFVITVIVSLFAGLIVFGCILEKFGEDKMIVTRKDVAAGKKAREELESLKNSPETKQLQSEYKDDTEIKKLVEYRISELWHQKWFDICK